MEITCDLMCELLHQVNIKGAYSYSQPHSPAFFKHMEILVPKYKSYLEGFMCEIACAKSV